MRFPVPSPLTLLLFWAVALPFAWPASGVESPLGPPEKVLNKTVEEWSGHLHAYENERQRKLAMFSLREFGAQAVVAVPELQKLLGEELQPEIPAWAAETLGCIGPAASAAVPALCALMKKSDRSAAEHAAVLAALVRIAPDDKQVRRYFEAALRDEDPELRHAAIASAVSMVVARPEYLANLQRALENPEDTALAARALACLGDDGLTALMKVFDRGESDLRPAIADGLRAMGPDARAAAPLLLEKMERERDADRRAHYEAALLSMGPQEPAARALAAARIAAGDAFSKDNNNAAPPAEAAPTSGDVHAEPYVLESGVLRAGGNSSVPEILNALRSPVAPARQLLIELLAALEDPPPNAIDALVARAQDRDESVQLAALRALETFGPKAAASRGALEELGRGGGEAGYAARLAAANVARDADAARLRSSFETRSIDDALAALKDADPFVRRDAAEGLRGRKEQQAAIASEMIRLIQDDANVDVRAAAARALSGYGTFSAPALELLRSWVKSSVEKPVDKDARQLATAALAGLAGMGDGAKPALDDLIALAVSPAIDDAKDMQRIVAICLRIIGPDATPLLVARFQADTAAVRGRAARVLGQMGPVGAMAIPDLLKLAESVVETDSAAAFAALEGMGTLAYPLAARPLVRIATGDLFVERRAAAVRALGGMGVPADGDPEHVLDTLQQALLDPDESVSRAAHNALVRIGAPALPHLLEMLELNEGGASYWWAVRSLARMKAASDRVVPLLVKLTRPGVRSVKAGAFAEQGVAAELLGNYAPEHREIIPALLSCLGDREDYVVNAAIRALKPFGPTIVDAIRPLLRHPDARMRDGALKALGELR
jgi:hypothetical protein